MAALLVTLSVMAVLMTAIMPAWRHIAQRDREEEMIFRAKQYARAIGLFQKKAGPGVLPQNIDILVEQRFLRRKYLDPITGEDFDLLYANAAPTLAPGGGGRGAQVGTPAGGRGSQPPGSTAPGGRSGQPPGTSAAIGRSGIIGVTSKSKAESIRIIEGRNHYNEMRFVYVDLAQQAGAGAGSNTANPSQGGRGGALTGPGSDPRSSGSTRGSSSMGTGSSPFGSPSLPAQPPPGRRD
jgi:type II secretory pathway pseudopilin PulG